MKLLEKLATLVRESDTNTMTRKDEKPKGFLLCCLQRKIILLNVS